MTTEWTGYYKAVGRFQGQWVGAVIYYQNAHIKEKSLYLSISQPSVTYYNLKIQNAWSCVS